MGNLKAMLIDRIDLCPAGDNPGADIVLFKRKPEEGGDDINPTNNLSNKKGDESMKLQDVLEKMSDDEQKLIKTSLDKKDEDLESIKKELEGKDEQIKKLQESVDELKKSKDDDDSSADVTTVLEKADPQVKEIVKQMQAQMEKAQAENESLVKKVDKMQSDIQRSQYVEIAKAYPNISSKPEELGDMLMTIGKAVPEETYTQLTETFKSLNKQLEDSELFKTKGSDNGDDSGSAWNKIEQLAKERAVKDSITIEKAQTIVIKENPDLYKAYKEESEV